MSVPPATSAVRPFDEQAALRALVEGTVNATGERFFEALVENLARILGTLGAWVTEYYPETRKLRALAFYMDGQWLRDWERPIDDTPCGAVIDTADLIHYPDNIIQIYPGDPDLIKSSAVSYMGVPLYDSRRRVMGHLAVLDRKPMPADEHTQALFRIFANRASAELIRIKAEMEIRDREVKISRVLDSAMDAIVELDNAMHITQWNKAAQAMFGACAQDVAGQDFCQFLDTDSRQALLRYVGQLASVPEGQRYLWLPSTLNAVRQDGGALTVEATLSSYAMHRQTFYALVLRNVNDRLEAENRIQMLTRETEYLRREIATLQEDAGIIGTSKALGRVLDEVRQVAATNATVLIHGETGTGKERFARAIHEASRRSDMPLIKVNCAAIPATLMESEFFGHEKGAFTGATEKREGRFALAHGGTIFLDEVGELPLDLQAKLLRVLQEGEFESVGSSKTRRVDVRVIAATNRDLKLASKQGIFREDLYYRLHVFPIHIPPLRERGEDILLLAEAFARRAALRIGRKQPRFDNAARARLMAYPWPGNVRELENVIERALITATGESLDLDRALPDVIPHSWISNEAKSQSGVILTAEDLQRLERANIVAALESANWKVSGPAGAAALLGMNASTLASRMKILGIKRPR
ncbi:MAG: hypothetical protein AMXMBFR84_25720 [Candidatus Hydrogenedentota bacterium]